MLLTVVEKPYLEAPTAVSSRPKMLFNDQSFDSGCSTPALSDPALFSSDDDSWDEEADSCQQTEVSRSF